MSARFRFDGSVVDPSADVSVREGLHHHGEEPSMAGYTLEEMYVLVRSLNDSQKTVGLATIANVIRKVLPSTLYHTSVDELRVYNA